MGAALPKELLHSLAGLPGFREEAFRQVHELASPLTSIRINPLKTNQPSPILPIRGQVPWSSYGYYLTQRPSFTFDPLFHAGTYYVQEASSMFLEQAMNQCLDLSRRLRVLDVSAAPGGKSTHLQSLLSPSSLLVSNEVIRSRSGILYENILKWGASNVVVTNNDPRDFSRLEGWFDVVLVDAPCSGSGLFRRDPDAIAEWSEQAVQLCSQRQQRILEDIIPVLKTGGLLIYSTCSYSKEEDEGIMDWLSSQGSWENLSLTLEPDWGIIKTLTEKGNKGYRFWPDQVKGEGFFLACFRKTEDTGTATIKPKKIEPLPRKFRESLGPWLDTQGLALWSHENMINAIHEEAWDELGELFSSLKVVNAGFKVGEWMRDKLVPDHGLAMSPRVSRQIPRLNLERDQSVRYLQRKEIAGGNQRGWQLVTFEGQALGWANVLPNRVNNYYPREMRILREDEGIA